MLSPPTPPSYRYALGPSEICSALTSLSLVRRLAGNATARHQVEYVLIFTYGRAGPVAASDAEYKASDALVNAFEAAGGMAEEVEVPGGGKGWSRR